ncbi:MAG: hypothetical protein V7719_06760 [Psychroserpens sp.]|uniref:hypothetical protein n=1 Tax=Psychroserpens sp. TaxID=2020870 RepID=UPI0030015AAF
MKKKFLSIFILIIFTSLSYGQNRNQRRQIPQNIDPEKDRAKYEEKAEKEKTKYISEFVATLEVDDFQKEIIMQTMDSYFTELRGINRLGLNSFDRKDYIELFDKKHFKDVKEIVSEDVMNKIMDAIKGKWDRNEEKKKKKKKKKNKDKN